MKPAILAGLIFWGTMARVLSELMTWSVEHTQQGLLWLCNGMWAGAAGMVVYAVWRWFRYERGQAHKEADHEHYNRAHCAPVNPAFAGERRCA